MDKKIRQQLEGEGLRGLIHKSLNYSEFIDTNYTKCSADEQNGSRRCQDYDKFIQTRQGREICFTLFHYSQNSDLEVFEQNFAVEPGYSQSKLLVGSE